MFRDVIGHPRARNLLEGAVRAGRPAHAYLFIGPEQVGKRTLGLAFARALTCSAPLDDRACGACPSCRLFAAGSHPDIRVIDRLSGAGDRRARPSRTIAIEVVRALQHDAALTAHLGGHKVYIVDGADALSYQAMDALLKTLEEPAAGVVIILTCVDGAALPATIVSRCQVVKFGLTPTDEIAAHIAATPGLDRERANLLAHLAAGRPGWAVAAAGQPTVLAERDAAIAALIELDDGSRADRLKFAERLAQEHGRDGDATAATLNLMLTWWRDVLMVGGGCDELVVNWDQLARLRQRAATVTLAEARAAIRAIEDTRQYLAENVQPRLAFELLALSLPRPNGSRA